jgi:acyl-CoA synthetase (AMP-forming)/AMP-acid ligase II
VQTPYDWLVRSAHRRPDEPALLIWRENLISRELSWRQLYEQVELARGYITANGVRAEDRVVLVLPNDSAFVITLLASIGAGVIAVPAPVPTVSRTEAFRDRLAGILTASGACALVTLSEWLPTVGAIASSVAPDCQILSIEEMEQFRTRPPLEPVRTRGSQIGFLQFTSGSTGTPRGVAVTYDAIAENCRQAAIMYNERPSDVAVTWVPLYHDMGLVTGLLRPLHVGYTMVLMRPEDFIRSPYGWLLAIDRCGATIGSAPNFAYELCVRKVTAAQAQGLNLSRWRVARNAGEVVRARSLDRFTAHFAAAGLAQGTMCPSYGLAEATLTVSSCAPGVTEPLRLRVRRADLHSGSIAPSGAAEPDTECLVSCGVPMPETSVRIKESEEDGRIGEILVRGPQIAGGYWTAGGVEPLRPSDSDWYATGDIGFMSQGHLFVLGRAKDSFSFHGRNYFAADVVAACSEIQGIRAGRVAAFIADAFTSREPAPALVAEIREDYDSSPDALSHLASVTQRLLARQLELYVRSIDFVKSGELPVTTSGKVRVIEVCRRHEAGAMRYLTKA